MLYEYMMENDICKAFQLYALRDYMKEHETITKMELMRILNENAPKDESNRFQQLTITKNKLQEYFPTFYTKSQMEKPRFIRIDEVMALLDVTRDEAMDIALAAGARYQLAKIILVHKERLMKFMKHFARVPSSRFREDNRRKQVDRRY